MSTEFLIFSLTGAGMSSEDSAKAMMAEDDVSGRDGEYSGIGALFAQQQKLDEEEGRNGKKGEISETEDLQQGEDNLLGPNGKNDEISALYAQQQVLELAKEEKVARSEDDDGPIFLLPMYYCSIFYCPLFLFPIFRKEKLKYRSCLLFFCPIFLFPIFIQHFKIMNIILLKNARYSYKKMSVGILTNF